MNKFSYKLYRYAVKKEMTILFLSNQIKFLKKCLQLFLLRRIIEAENFGKGMKAVKKKFLTVCLAAGLLAASTGVALADEQVTVTVPAFPVTLNGLTIEQTNNQYPSLVYKDITYVPMTYYDAQLLGLDSQWEAQSGLAIQKTAFVADQITAQQRYVPYKSAAANAGNYTALRPSFAITVNGKSIDNSKEEYPLLVFRDVTYFPLTWRFAVDEFGWNYTFDGKTGLNITPVPTAIVPDSSISANQTAGAVANGSTVTVSGSMVHLRSGAGTGYAVVGQVGKGERLTVLGSGNDADGKVWYQVQTKSGKAWIASWLVTAGTVSPAANSSSNSATDSQTGSNVGKTVYVTGDAVNLRSGAGTGYGQIGQAGKGDSFVVLSSGNDADGKAWYQVEMEDGARVWIASWLTSTTKPSSAASTVSTGARTMVEMRPVLQDGKKTVVSLKHGEGNVYSLEKVSGTQLQILLDNVTLGNQTSTQGNGFTVTMAEAGSNQVRVTVDYSLGSYASLEQEGDWLTLNCYHTSSGLAGRTIVLDPGHGGSDVGAQGITMKDVTDADIGYTVAVKLRAMLEAAGANVVMTREALSRNQKVFMTERIEMNNQLEPDIFISIHANSTEGATTATGAETYTYNGKIYSQQYLSVNLAEKICAGLKVSTNQKSVTKSANYYVLRMNNHPAVLVETAYLSNYSDEKLLATDAYRQKLAEGIYQGVLEYFNQF